MADKYVRRSPQTILDKKVTLVLTEEIFVGYRVINVMLDGVKIGELSNDSIFDENGMYFKGWDVPQC